jgi:bacterioferritin
MKGHADVLDALQQVLTLELTGINQYFIHSKLAKNWGWLRLAGFEWQESMDEMKHADKVIDRMLFLDGAPNLSRYDKIIVGKDVKAMLESDLALELKAHDVQRKAIESANHHHDHGTRELIEHLLVNEEEHIDWLETQLGKIEQLGLPQWLAHQQFGDPKKAEQD